MLVFAALCSFAAANVLSELEGAVMLPRGLRIDARRASSLDRPSSRLCAKELTVCAEALERDGSYEERWTRHRAMCARSFCLCVPGGKYQAGPSGSVGTCSSPVVSSGCSVRDRCAPLVGHDCMLTFERQYPPGCQSFLNCSHAPEVEKADFQDCMETMRLHERLSMQRHCDNARVCGGNPESGPGPRNSVLIGTVLLSLIGFSSLVAFYNRQRRRVMRRALALVREVGVEIPRGPEEAAAAAPAVCEYKKPSAAPRNCVECGGPPAVLFLPCYCLLCNDCSERHEVTPPEPSTAPPPAPDASSGELPQPSEPAGVSGSILRHVSWNGRKQRPQKPADAEMAESLTCSVCSAGCERIVRLAQIFPTGGAAPGATDSGGAAESSESDYQRLDLDDSDGKCVVCCEQTADVAFIPCGHMASCRTCAGLIASTKGKGACIMCREHIAATVDLSGLLVG